MKTDTEKLIAERDAAVQAHTLLAKERMELAKEWWKITAYNSVLDENNAYVAILAKIAQEAPTSLSDATKASLAQSLEKPRCAAFLGAWQAQEARLMTMERLVAEFVTELATCSTTNDAATAAARFSGAVEHAKDAVIRRVDVFDNLQPAVQAITSMSAASGLFGNAMLRERVLESLCGQVHSTMARLWDANHNGTVDDLCLESVTMAEAGIPPSTEMEFAIGMTAYLCMAAMGRLDIDSSDILRRCQSTVAVVKQ